MDALARGDREAVLQLYAPDCVIHRQATAEKGRRAIEACIDRNPLLGSGHGDVRIRGIGSRVHIQWTLSVQDQARVPESEQGTQATLRIAHGQIAEQW
ncbi:MAG TPA: nuclear transport factor 2 family protein [Candidatus Udaeobacter sp.]|nr:nuclear transport factor 2 family protein [Candidatus Udaeobacter sp.]